MRELFFELELDDQRILPGHLKTWYITRVHTQIRHISSSWIGHNVYAQLNSNWLGTFYLLFRSFPFLQFFFFSPASFHLLNDVPVTQYCVLPSYCTPALTTPHHVWASSTNSLPRSSALWMLWKAGYIIHGIGLTSRSTSRAITTSRYVLAGIY